MLLQAMLRKGLILRKYSMMQNSCWSKAGMRRHCPFTFLWQIRSGDSWTKPTKRLTVVNLPFKCKLHPLIWISGMPATWISEPETFSLRFPVMTSISHQPRHPKPIQSNLVTWPDSIRQDKAYTKSNSIPTTIPEKQWSQVGWIWQPVRSLSTKTIRCP